MIRKIANEPLALVLLCMVKVQFIVSAKSEEYVCFSLVGLF